MSTAPRKKARARSCEPGTAIRGLIDPTLTTFKFTTTRNILFADVIKRII